MSEGFRYNMQHLGDIVVGKLTKICCAIKESTRGIILTYDIHDLEKERIHLIRDIGRRIVAIRKNHPELDIFRDDQLMELFFKLDKVEAGLEDRENERKAKLDPANLAAEEA
ncbi:MAG: hypothetical protein HQK57_06900 [Deltaproteobacteria bacterium]|nr:hypothetical protein [Deltaproteobacteria bacterium]MBF0526019.1 hypothetical protein [Deltaproteobacteria bacterium]